MQPSKPNKQVALKLVSSFALALLVLSTPASRADAASTDQSNIQKPPQTEALNEQDETKADKSSTAWQEIWKRVKLGTVWYLHYGFGEEEGQPYNQARIGRGYVTLKIKPLKWFKTRVTMDTHQIDEGESKGDFTVRLKYMYGEFVAPIETDWITEPAVEFGLVHGPWFDYEEDINHYRAQGTMFIERNKVLNSADAGVTFKVLLGSKLNKEYQETVSDAYPGTWGSIAFGGYNGGGYHATEENQNKVFASRVSLRPIGPWLPNLQVSHFFVYGKGNTKEEPAYMLNAFMGSFEHQYFVLSGQYSFGKGNQKGDKIFDSGKALPHQGFSVFSEIKLPWIWSRIIGRYDHWEWDGDLTQRAIAGLAFYFYKYNYIMIDYDRVMYEQSGKPSEYEAKLTLQVHF